jgi:type VI secretion system protein ImpM
MTPGAPQIVLYGKIPAQGDFVRVNAEFREAYWFDQWLQQGIAAAKEGNRAGWGPAYGSFAGLSFLLRPSGSDSILLGSLIPSEDKSHREYPLWTAVLLDREGPRGERGVVLPILYRAYLNETSRSLQLAKQEKDGGGLKDAATRFQETIPVQADEIMTEYAQYINSQSIAGFVRQCTGASESARRMELFIGLHHLLSPMVGRDLSKWRIVVRCPLGDGLYGTIAATFWLQYVMRILKEPDAMPSLLWTLGQESYLYLVFRDLPVTLFGLILHPDVGGGDVFRLEDDGRALIADAGGGGGKLRSLLDRESSTLGELLQAL